MGIITQGKHLWDALFTRTQRQVLGLLFGHPERSFYANEVVRLAGVGTGSTQRELKRLTDAGLLTCSSVGNQKHYQANRACPVFAELRGIVIKTFGVMEQLRDGLLGLDPELSLAMLFGEGAETSGHYGLKLLLVSGSLSHHEVMARLPGIEARIGREIELTLMSPAAFQRAREQGTSDLQSILAQPKVLIHGSIDRASG